MLPVPGIDKLSKGPGIRVAEFKNKNHVHAMPIGPNVVYLVLNRDSSRKVRNSSLRRSFSAGTKSKC